MSAHKNFCAVCHALLFEQPPDGNDLHHASGLELKSCAETESRCCLCAALWSRCSAQQRTDICADTNTAADNGDDNESREDMHVRCNYENNKLRFTLPIPFDLREKSYGSTMPQIVDIDIEHSFFGPSFLGDTADHGFSGITFDASTAKLARSWIDNCRQNHAHCNASPKVDFVPTRLVEVGTLEEPILRLREMSTVSGDTRYVTLSHRWGVGKILMLLESNKQALLEAISPRDISKEFQDAAQIARLLNVRFIWIDSLCIIQDSAGAVDWVFEAARMADCYEHAYCTISASASADEDRGMILGRNPELVGPLYLDLSEPSRTNTTKSSLANRFFKATKQALNTKPPPGHLLPVGTYVCKDRQVWSREVNESPLNRRGWIFQERMLSTRMLHFGRTQVFFECVEQQCSEDHPKQIDKDIFGEIDFKAQSPQALLTKLRDQRTEIVHYAPSIWAHTVSQYSRCPFTFGTDRLVALAGVARRYQSLMSAHDAYSAAASRIESTHGTAPDYFMGTWLCNANAVSNLCWNVTAELIPRPADLLKKIPSWSWGSVLSSVGFGPVQLSTETSDLAVDLATIVKVDAVFDAVSDGAQEDAMWMCRLKDGAGAMWLEGSLLPVRLSVTELLDAVQADDARRALVGAGTWPGNPVMWIGDEPQRWDFHADELRPITTLTDHGWLGTYFAVGFCFKASESRVYGAVLEWIDGSNGCFRRVGSFMQEVADVETFLRQTDHNALDERFYETKSSEGRVRIKLI